MDAVETPIRDLVRDLAEELVSGWRLKADAPNGLAGHVCGEALSKEVGRILHASLSPPKVQRCAACQGDGGRESPRRGWIPCDACGGRGY